MKSEISTKTLLEKKKTMEHEDDNDSCSNGCPQNNLQMTGQGTRRLGNKRTSGDHPDCSIFKINQNAEMNPLKLEET